MRARVAALVLAIVLAAMVALPAAAAVADSLAVVTDSLPSDSLASTPPAPPVRDLLAEARAGYTTENRAYQGIRVWLRLLGPLYGILVGMLLLFTGLSVRFRQTAEALGHSRYVQVLVYFTLYSLAVFAASLPLAWYEEFALEHQFGLSTQTLGGWALDSFKGLVFSVAAVAVVPVLWLAWRAVERSPRGWWLWLAAGTLPVALAATLLQPLVFDPLFNRFTPLRDASLRAGILELGARAGIPGRDVYEVDMSARTRKVNAYVNGFGASQRIVLWDTTLEQLERDEILFVMGHEMGHYVLHHIWKGLLATSLGAFAAFALTAAMVHGLLRRFAARWGVRGVHDLAAMPLVIAALTLVSFTGQPVVNAVSRHMEHESDIYGLEITRDNDAAARAFLKLATHNRSDPEPRPWVRFLFYTHPPLAERIVFAQGYRPWERGEPNRLYRGR